MEHPPVNSQEVYRSHTSYTSHKMNQRWVAHAFDLPPSEQANECKCLIGGYRTVCRVVFFWRRNYREQYAYPGALPR